MRQIIPRSNNGSILLRFTYLGKRYNLNPVPGGRFDDKLAYAKACEVASRIQRDCITEDFDPTLAKYKPQLKKPAADNEVNTTATSQANNNVNLLELFKEFTAEKRKTLRENSLTTDYRSVDNKLSKCPHKYTRDAKKIVEWLIRDCCGTTSSSVKKHWALINACCNWAVDYGKLQNNPFDGTKRMLATLKKHTKTNTAKPFSPEERDRIIEAFKKHSAYKHYAPLVEFLFFTGCRPGEAIALQWKHLKGNAVTICQVVTVKGHVEKGTKTEPSRDFLLNERAMSALEGLKANEVSPEELIFKSATGSVILWSHFSFSIWRKVLATVPDIEYRNAYQMRHTAITRMVKNGTNTSVVARHVGNSTRMIDARYLGDVSDVPMQSV